MMPNPGIHETVCRYPNPLQHPGKNIQCHVVCRVLPPTHHQFAALIQNHRVDPSAQGFAWQGVVLHHILYAQDEPLDRL